MGKTSLNVIVSGLGRIAWQFHLPVLAADPRFQLLAAADPVTARLQEAESTYPGLRTYADTHQMLETEKTADLLIVASPTPFMESRHRTHFFTGWMYFVKNL